jgi:hypothetical protein
MLSDATLVVWMKSEGRNLLLSSVQAVPVVALNSAAHCKGFLYVRMFVVTSVAPVWMKFELRQEAPYDIPPIITNFRISVHIECLLECNLSYYM